MTTVIAYAVLLGGGCYMLATGSSVGAGMMLLGLVLGLVSNWHRPVKPADDDSDF